MMSSANRKNFNSTFWSVCISCLIAALARTYSTMLNMRGERLKFCHVSNHRCKAFSSPLLGMMLIAGFRYSLSSWVLDKDLISSLFLTCWEFLSWIDVGGCQIMFCMDWYYHMLFLPYLIDMMYYTNWFSKVEPSFLYLD